MPNEEVDGYYQIRAKEIIDLLFDKKYFREDVSRDDMQDIENFLGWTLQTQCNMSVKCALLSKRIKDNKS